MLWKVGKEICFFFIFFITLSRSLNTNNVCRKDLFIFQIRIDGNVSGGNFEPVAIICETNWKECIIAVANYLWSEVVSDVVDYLAKEGIIWVRNYTYVLRIINNCF